ncbi:hypothetical protein ACIQMR_31730 [Streptomyces sp. NPDC091376]|uniref:hypothetical protein n=1 Tax=Streptomyces sp. NPDC091376 TaxID=3365994 RepID=UPI00381ECD4B
MEMQYPRIPGGPDAMWAGSLREMIMNDYYSLLGCPVPPNPHKHFANRLREFYSDLEINTHTPSDISEEYRAVYWAFVNEVFPDDVQQVLLSESSSEDRSAEQTVVQLLNFIGPWHQELTGQWPPSVN